MAHDTEQEAGLEVFLVILFHLLLHPGSALCFLMSSVECREVFADFDPNAIVKMNEKLLLGPGSTGSALLSDLRLRAVIENARQILKVDPSSTLCLFLQSSRDLTFNTFKALRRVWKLR